MSVDRVIHGIVYRKTHLILWAVVFLLSGCVTTPLKEKASLELGRDAMAENRVQGAFFPNTLSQAATAREGRSFGLQVSRRLVSTTLSKGKVRPVVKDVAHGKKPKRSPSGKMSWVTDADKSLMRRIDVQAVRRPARDFFMSLVHDEPGVNMIVHPDVSGKISLELKNMNIDEVVEITCEMYRFDCRPFVGSTRGTMRGYKIFPWQLATRTYHVDFLPVVRHGHSETLVSSGNKRMPTLNQQGQHGSTTENRASGSRVRTEYKSDFWDELENTIRSILRLNLSVSRQTEQIDSLGKVSKTIERERSGVHQSGIVRKHTNESVDREDGLAEKHVSGSLPILEDNEMAEALPSGEKSYLSSEKGIMLNRQAGLVTVRAYPQEHQEIATFLEQLRNRS